MIPGNEWYSQALQEDAAKQPDKSLATIRVSGMHWQGLVTDAERLKVLELFSNMMKERKAQAAADERAANPAPARKVKHK